MFNLISLKHIDFKIFFLITFPITLIIGNFFANAYLFLILLYFFYYLIKKKISISADVIFFLIFFFYIYGILNSLYNYSGKDSVIRAISFIKYPILFYFISSIKINNIQIKFILTCYFFLILLLSLDVFLQFFTGINLIGFEVEKSIYEGTSSGRLGSFFGDEMVVGAYISNFIGIVSAFLLINFRKQKIIKFLIILLIFIFLTAIFLSGERTSFIKSLILVFCLYLAYSLFFTKKFSKKNLILFIILLSSIFVITFKNPYYFKRYEEALVIIKNFENSSYGRLQQSSIIIIKNNLLFGVGPKNYRIECTKIKEKLDPNPNHQYPFCSTHPHNIYFELLVEHGLVGAIMYIFIILLIFKKFMINKEVFVKNKSNLIFLSSALSAIIPFLLFFLPSGSLFSSFNGIFYWYLSGMAMMFLNNDNYE